MTFSLYAATVPVLTRQLNSLLRVIGKAEAYAAERKFDVNNFYDMRLAPDMHPFRFQVQSASDHAKFIVSRLTGKTPHNIRDYIQRDRIKKFDTEGNIIEYAKNGQLRVSLKEVRAFLYLVSQRDEKHHHAGLHPELGFYDVPEHQRTKHVHRLHPYLGKFIPQLVEWFLKRYFKPGNWILDPFMGSGTTLVQANQIG